MNNKRIIIILSVVCGLSVILNITQAYGKHQIKQKLSTYQTELKTRNKTLKQRNAQIDSLNDKVDILNQSLNNKGKSASETAFNNVSQQFIKAMFSFNPNSYEERKAKIEPLVSDQLMKQYFPKGHYGDANGVTSRVDQAKVYEEALQGDKMNGLAVITFESKSGDNDFQKQTVVYQLTMDTKTNKLTKVQDLGTVTTGSDVSES